MTLLPETKDQRVFCFMDKECFHLKIIQIYL